MFDSGQQDLFSGTEFGANDEGAFDAQLFLSSSATTPHEALRTVVKRSGREEPFDPGKVVTAILNASHETDHVDSDTAVSLARGVTIYLSRRISAGPPTAEQVAEAVEQVLFGMGHVRTGLAYSRYRDRRDRIRRLKAGDVRGFLGEIEDTKRRNADAIREAPAVRTADDQLSQWDRSRIVDTLIREAQADRATAETVAAAVDEQVRNGNVKTITAALIREMVDAKLVELGREDLRRRHARLGVPLFDAEQIICAPNADESVANHVPESTETLLAQRVKRAFALESVFDGEVAMAHHRGDIHLHGLGTIDRLHSGVYGAQLVHSEPDNADTVAPRHSLEAGRRLGQWHAFLRGHFGRRVTWEGLSDVLAQVGSAPPGSRQGDAFLRALGTGITQPATGPRMALQLSWPTDSEEFTEETDEEAVANRASRGNAARAWAQFFAEEAYLFDPNGPEFIFHITEQDTRDPDAAAYLSAVVDAALVNKMASIALDRGGDIHGLMVGPITAHKVTLNVCRAAIAGGDIEGCLRVLESQFESAINAHLQKKSFLDRLVALGAVGPLSGLAMRRDGESIGLIDRARWAIGIAGVNECVEHLTGSPIHESNDAREAASLIMRSLDEWTRTVCRQENMHFVLAQTLADHVRMRLAHSDVRQHGDAARRLVKIEGLTQDVTYTAGAQIAAGVNVTPMDRLRIEGEGQAIIPGDACASVVLPVRESPHEAMIEFLRTAIRRTSIRRLRFA